MNILVVNAGSSSLKLRLLDDADRIVASKDLPSSDPQQVGSALASFIDENPQVEAAGHRIVHGGSEFKQPILLNDGIDQALEALADLAPLHDPPSLAAIHTLRELLPSLPQVACFDTSFHAELPAKAATYAVPLMWRERWGVRRFGFHGLSHAWAARRAAELLGQRQDELRLVTAHLGGGASLAAVAFGHSVDTTMGFTPMEGLVMATRSGSIDPGVLLWVQRRGGLSADQLETALELESGLRGLSGVSGDLRQVTAAADAGNQEAQLAYDVYVYRIQTSVAAMCAAMGGIDGLVFTGGAGEASPRLRADVCAGLGFLGVRIDKLRNDELSGDGLVSAAQAPADVLVVVSREDLEIARHVRNLLA